MLDVQGGTLLPTKATIHEENQSMRDVLERVRSELALLQSGQSRAGSIDTVQVVGFVRAMTDIIGASCYNTAHQTGSLQGEGRPAAGRPGSPSPATAALLAGANSLTVETPARLGNMTHAQPLAAPPAPLQNTGLTAMTNPAPPLQHTTYAQQPHHALQPGVHQSVQKLVQNNTTLQAHGATHVPAGLGTMTFMGATQDAQTAAPSQPQLYTIVQMEGVGEAIVPASFVWPGLAQRQFVIQTPQAVAHPVATGASVAAQSHVVQTHGHVVVQQTMPAAHNATLAPNVAFHSPDTGDSSAPAVSAALGA